jgi:CheY-like chemotaxis protein
LTAFARSEDRKRAMLAGFDAHLAKPFDLAEFLLVIARLVNRKSH